MLRRPCGWWAEHAATQQVQVGAAVHLALEELYIGWSGVKPWEDEKDRSPETRLCVAS